MSKGNTFETNLLNHIFVNSTITLIGDAAGLLASAGEGSLYVGLHVADPGEAGSQNTSPATYTGYAYAAVARNTGGWTVSGNSVSNAGIVAFPACTGGSDTLTHFSVGTDSSGAGKILYKGALGTSIQGPFTAKVDDTITIPGHTFSVSDRCAFYPAFGSALPTGVTEGTIYWVKTVSGDDITISTTDGGATLNITAVGDGVAIKALTLAVSSGITPQFAIGALVIAED